MYSAILIGLCIGVTLTLLILFKCFYSVLGRQWNTYPKMFYTTLKDRKDPMWLLGAYLCGFSVLVCVLIWAFYNQGSPRSTALWGFVIYYTALMCYRIWWAIREVGFHPTRWNAVWRATKYSNCPAVKIKDRNNILILLAVSVVVTLFLSWLGVFG